MSIRAMSRLGAALAVAVVSAALLAAPGGGSTPGAAAPIRPRRLTARRLEPRPRWAVARGTTVRSSDLFTDRVFATASDGFALASLSNAQFPACSHDAGRTWATCGPAVHVDAADGPEGVGHVGVAGPRTFFAYGSSAVDVTSDGGRTWWETFLGELVVAVVSGPRNDLVAYVQQQLTSNSLAAVTWQYVSRDRGRHWSYSHRLGGE